MYRKGKNSRAQSIDLSTNKVQEYMNIFLVGCIIGALLFVCTYGIKILDVTYVDWLYESRGEDIFQHQIGFDYFRNAPWTFPVGVYTNYTYPNETSIVFTDSIPIFAIIFKLIRGILPPTFQYFGIWGIVSFSLQGGVASLIIRKFTEYKPVIFITSVFFIYSSTVLQRMYAHTSLAAHWIILLAILAWVYKENFNTTKKQIILWCTITGISILIHPYFIVMNGVIMVGVLIDEYIENRNLRRVLCVFSLAVICTLTLFWSIGGFISGTGDNSGLGFFSMNTNALFNPREYSIFLRPLPNATDGQYEGFQYLGLGIILMIPIVMYNFAAGHSEHIKNNIRKNMNKVISILFVLLTLFILALSPVITINRITLVSYLEIPIVEKVLSNFRSTGRLFWPGMYIVMLILIWNIISSVKENKKLLGIMATFVIIQVVDLSGIIAIKNKNFNTEYSYQSILESPFWEKARHTYKHIDIWGKDIDAQVDLAIYAQQNNLTLSNGAVARKDNEEEIKRVETLVHDMEQGILDKEYIYVINGVPSAYMIKHPNIIRFTVDGIDMIVANGSIELEENDGIKILENNTLKYQAKELPGQNYEDVDEYRVINPNGISYGPYISLNQGMYEVIYTGQNLDKAYFDIMCQKGEIQIQPNEQHIEDTTIRAIFELKDSVDDIEFRVFNYETEDIVVDGLTINKID